MVGELSEDGKWQWDGTEWIPAQPQSNQSMLMQDSVVGGDVVATKIVQSSDADVVRAAIESALGTVEGKCHYPEIKSKLISWIINPYDEDVSWVEGMSHHHPITDKQKLIDMLDNETINIIGMMDVTYEWRKTNMYSCFRSCTDPGNIIELEHPLALHIQSELVKNKKPLGNSSNIYELMCCLEQLIQLKPSWDDHKAREEEEIGEEVRQFFDSGFEYESSIRREREMQRSVTTSGWERAGKFIERWGFLLKPLIIIIAFFFVIPVLQSMDLL